LTTASGSTFVGAVYTNTIDDLLLLADKYNGLITATATALLAFITWRLSALAHEQSVTTRAQLRSYVFVSLAEFAHPPNDEIQPWDLRLVFKNYGETPAYNAVVYLDFAISDPKDDGVSWASSATARVSEGINHIPPSEIHTAHKPELINGIHNYRGLSAAGKRAYIWGRLEYFDAFGTPHFTKFQMVHFFGRIYQFSFCSAGNSTDDLPEGLGTSGGKQGRP
jgi:hypothetical protein